MVARTASRATSWRRLRSISLRRVGALTLSQRFLLAAVVVVALAMAALGSWISYYLQSSITQGIASTASASIESLIVHSLDGVGPDRPLASDDRLALDEVFVIGNDADSTRLLQIRIRDLSGALLYESSGGLRDSVQADGFEMAAGGRMSANVREIGLEPVGPLPTYKLSVLKIYIPLHRADDNSIFAVAALYYSAKNLHSILQQAQFDVWALVGFIGAAVVLALYLLVHRASRTIAEQRATLASNLAASKRLSDENSALHEASEVLRLNAISANEALLNQVGADIHDGPMQLMTLVILRLSQDRGDDQKANALRATAKLASEAIEELRNISTGLVLPEIATLDIPTAIRLAIGRHEAATGTHVEWTVGEMPERSSMALNTCVYRVVQEALNNAFRHGGGQKQQVGAVVEGEILVLSVSNASAGESEGPRNRAGGLGLRGMRLRVEALGGSLTATSFEGRAVVVARVPLGPPIH